ncbi:MAG: hypothetical protein ACFFD1_09600, partial [Candidatus Thorarchaeota archaeon]
DLLNAVKNNNQNLIIDAYNEIKRGIEYANNTPGSITDLLVRIGQGMIGPVIVEFRLEKKGDTPKSAPELNELKTFLKQKQQDKVVNKMKGSLSSLKDLEDDE